MTIDILTVVLVVFYLFLAVKWRYIRHPVWYALGVFAVLASIFAAFLHAKLGPSLADEFIKTAPVYVPTPASRFLYILGTFVAFGAGVAAAYGGGKSPEDKAAEELKSVLKVSRQGAPPPPTPGASTAPNAPKT